MEETHESNEITQLKPIESKSNSKILQQWAYRWIRKMDKAYTSLGRGLVLTRHNLYDRSVSVS